MASKAGIKSWNQKLESKAGIKSWNQKLESKAGELIESSEPAKKTRDFEVDTFELYP